MVQCTLSTSIINKYIERKKRSQLMTAVVVRLYVPTALCLIPKGKGNTWFEVCHTPTQYHLFTHLMLANTWSWVSLSLFVK
jgi:hypothetical protein